VSVFGEYARFYDLLYESKDYLGECAFLERIFESHALRPVRSVLDLGCGTGGHIVHLARRGFELAGLDRSEQMLAKARRKVQEAGLAVDLHLGDLRDVNLGRTFDAVIAMFAVMSYQVSNADLAGAFRSARRHLAPGGLFVHDAWFGPAVLTNPPTDRYRIIEKDGDRVVRFAHPEIDVVRHLVTVHYKLLRLRGGAVVEEIDEAHPMRTLFVQEAAYFAEQNGFELVRACPFLEPERVLTTDDWNACFVARAL